MDAKIIITGPGRSGTTFITQLLTRLGFDTGYEPYNEQIFPGIRAGCEWVVGWYDLSKVQRRVNLENAPKVLKAPEWSLALKELFATETYPVELVILPLRDLRIAAQSRLDAGLHYLTDGTLDDQESVHALMLGKCIEACELYHVPYVILHFPKLVQDAYYCIDKLNKYLDIDYTKGIKLHSELANLKEIKWKNEREEFRVTA